MHKSHVSNTGHMTESKEAAVISPEIILTDTQID